MRRMRYIVLAFAAGTAGCHGIHAKWTPVKILCRHRAENLAARQDDKDPACTARALEAALDDTASAAVLTELADACFHAAHELDADAARAWYRDAAVYAAFAVAEGDDCCQRAQQIHNQSVERLIRQAQARRVRKGRDWQCTFDDLNIALRGPPFLDPCRYSELEIAADYATSAIQCEYRNDGFGVPIIALRDNNRECPADRVDRYFSHRIHAAATALIRPCGTPANWRQHRVELALFDPFETRSAIVAGRSVVLATDRTTPLAVQEEFSSLEFVRRAGAIRPDRVENYERGLYMYQPYRRGKIPVVLMHGFHSSPSTWSQIVNHVQNDPELSERYQVWLFLYPTGAPITASAADLRAALREAIAFFDPCGEDAALHEMVLVGHSMGGMIGKMAVMESGDTLWRAYFNTTVDELQCSSKVRSRLQETLFLHPEPYVSRLIMISTPHRGSTPAAFLPGQLIQGRIRYPEELREIIREVRRSNRPDAVAEGVRVRPLNGIGGMSPRDPALNAVLGMPITVPFHSIIPQLQIAGRSLQTDGIVRHQSSHLDGAESEKIIRGFHTSHDSCESAMEIMRILREN